MTSTLVQSRSQEHNGKLRSNAGFWNLTARTSLTDDRGHAGETLVQCLRRDSCQRPDGFQAWNFLSLWLCALPSDGRHNIGTLAQGQRGSSLGPRSLYGHYARAARMLMDEFTELQFMLNTKASTDDQAGLSSN